LEVLVMVKSGSLETRGLRIANAPLCAEGKEFLLTERGQSVMNIFTASGFSVQFCIRFL
jgi:hypothetical protein